MTQQELKQNLELRLEDNPVKGEQDKKPIQISSLFNALHYFVEIVFIMTVEGGYRLLVIHEGKLLTDKTYKTVKGARIGFSEVYRDKAWRDDVKAEWSRFYSPVSGWVAKKLSAKKATESKTQKVRGNKR